MKNVFLGLIFSAFAVPTFAQPHISAELLLGSAEQTSKADGETLSTGDDISVGMRGAININDYLAAELAYQHYGEIDDTYIDGFGDTINDKVSTKAITAGIKGIIPLDNKIALNARLGISRWDLSLHETDSSVPNTVFTFDDTSTDIYYGVGVQFKAAPQLLLSAEYTVTQMQPSFYGVTIDHDVSNFALSIGYMF